MFAFSQVQPNTVGRIDKMNVPFTDYLSTSVDEALHLSPIPGIYRSSELYFAKYNEQLPISPELANERYALADLRFNEPITEEAAQLLRDRKQAELDRAYILSSDQNALTKIAGMGTGMVASLVDPVNLALMFVPVVGRAPMLGPVRDVQALTRGAVIRETLAKGLITETTLAEMLPFPRFASSIIQGGTFMTVAELPKQLVGMYEQEDVGNPIANIAIGTALAGGLHVTLSAVARAWVKMSPEVKSAIMLKGMNDFVQGRDIDVATLAETDEAFVSAMLDLEIAGKEGEWPTRFKPEDFMTAEEASVAAQKAYESRVQGIFKSAIAKLRQELPQPSKQTPVVPETAPEAETRFTSALDEIRKKNARTTAQVQELFPQAKLSRQEAAALRRAAWNEAETKQVAQQNSLALLEDLAKDLAEKSKGPGVKRQNRLAAEAAMPNPVPQRIDVEIHAEVPEDVTINHIQQQADEVVKKVKAKIKKAKDTVIKTQKALTGTLKDFGFIPRKGKLGKQGFWTVTDKGINVSVQEDANTLTLVRIERADRKDAATKGLGAKIIERLKEYADKTQKPIRLTAELDAQGKPQVGLEAYYEDLGFTRDVTGDNTFTYLPKGYDFEAKMKAMLSEVKTPEPVTKEAKSIKPEAMSQVQQLVDNLDTFSPARDTGQRNYDLYDIVDNFITHLRENPDMSVLQALTEFRKTADASKRRLTQLATAVKQELEAFKPKEVKSVKPEDMSQEKRSTLELELGESLTALQKRLEATRGTTPIESVVKSAIDCLGKTTI